MRGLPSASTLTIEEYPSSNPKKSKTLSSGEDHTTISKSDSRKTKSSPPPAIPGNEPLTKQLAFNKFNERANGSEGTAFDFIIINHKAKALFEASN